jgi:hypothetical protein
VFRWTGAAVEKLRKLRAEGLKNAEIGDILGCSHDTVIRKAAKEGLSLRINHKLQPKPLGVQVLPITERIGVAQAVLALHAYHCKWPIGSPSEPDFHFCSAPRINMSGPYCEKHQHVAIGGRG